jgi:hypothetical protein
MTNNKSYYLLFLGLFFITFPKKYFCQALSSDTIFLSTYLSEDVRRQELITIHTNALTLTSKKLDSLINIQNDCNQQFGSASISHFTMLFDIENHTLNITFEEGSPDSLKDLCGVYFRDVMNKPYLIYSDNCKNDFFQLSPSIIVVRYLKFFNDKDEDISNEIQLIDEREIHSGFLIENNLWVNYYVESCY